MMSDISNQALEEFKERMGQFRNRVDIIERKNYIRAVEDAARLNQRRFEEEGKYLGNFTSHGPDHSARMMRYILSLIDSWKKIEPPDFRIRPRELFVLGLSAYLHDLGMTEPLPDSLQGLSKTEESIWIARRKRHADAVEDAIRRYSDSDLAFLKQNQPILFNKFLVDLCRAHSTKNFNECISRLKHNRDSDRETRYSILAGFLLLADELDITRERARMDYEHYNRFSTLTKMHWWKHWLVESCDLEGTNIKFVYIPDSQLKGADVFKDWTEYKLNSQIEMLQTELDPVGDKLWSRLVVLPISTGILDATHAQVLTNDIINHARAEISPKPVETRINSPVSLIGRVRDRDQAMNASDAYQKLFWPNIAVFRGQGIYATPDMVFETYVWVEQNKKLIDKYITKLAEILEKRRLLPEKPTGGDPHRDDGVGEVRHPRNLWPIVGEIGVGKTHFLQMLLFKFKEEHPDLYQSTIIVHCETMQNSQEHQTMLDIKRQVAKDLYKEVARVIGIEFLHAQLDKPEYQRIHIPSLVAEIETYSLIETDTFISIIGSLINESDGKKILGQRQPIAICIFLDNSDRLPDELILSLHRWAHDLSGGIAATIMMFYRPGTYDKISARYHALDDHISTRDVDVVIPPDPYKLLTYRIQYLFKKVLHFEKISVVEIPDLEQWLGSRISLPNPEEAVNNLCQNLLKHSSRMLSSLAGTNMRLLLQTFVRILGSWIIDSQIFMRFMTQSVTNSRSEKSGWPKLIEALMLGHRRWYNPKMSPVENLFQPPEVDHYGDYLVAIHIMQIITFNSHRPGKGEDTLAHLRQTATNLGYREARIDQVLQWLSTKQPIAIGDDVDYQIAPLIKGTLPDNKPFDPGQEPYHHETRLDDTQWGNYHLSTLIYQFKYWKHVLYTIVIPQSLADGMKGDLDQIIEEVEQYENVLDLISYLSEYETEWFANRKDARELGVIPIMKTIHDSIIRQKDIWAKNHKPIKSKSGSDR